MTMIKGFLKTIVVHILTWEATRVLNKHTPTIICVTGSVGKTSTKDAIFHVLDDGTIRKSEKSFNSELGIPLTVLNLENAWGSAFGWGINLIKGFLRSFETDYPHTLILEVGADHPGDIARAMTWVKPDIACVTRLPERPVHVEYFTTPDALLSEKAELVRALKPQGIFIANADDPRVRELSHLTSARMLTFGFAPDADVRGSDVTTVYGDEGAPHGMSITVTHKGGTVTFMLRGVIGEQSLSAVLAGIAHGVARGISLETIAQKFSSYTSAPGRMRLILGRAQATLIDDSYNASPVAVEAALLTLKNIKAARKIALLGDMLELGRFSEEEHTKIGLCAGEIVDELVTVGRRATGIAEGALHAGLHPDHIHQFKTSVEAGEWMKGKIKAGDVILIKGSQGSGENMIRMERAVKILMAHPEDAKALLVRQEDAWQRHYQ